MESWTKAEWTIHALNVQGTFFEQWCRHQFARLPQTEVVTTNYPVAFRDGGGVVHQSNLDIWATSINENNRQTFFVECKKNNPRLTDWVFFERHRLPSHPFFTAHGIRLSMDNDSGKQTVNAGVANLKLASPIFEEARETKGDFSSAKRGDFTKTSNSAITDAAQQVVIAFKDVYAQHLQMYTKVLEVGGKVDFESQLFFPCIITSAKLYSCHFDPLKVDAQTGEIQQSDAALNEIPFAVLEYPLPRYFQYIPTELTSVEHGKLQDNHVRLHILVINSKDFERWIGPDLGFLTYFDSGKPTSKAHALLMECSEAINENSNVHVKAILENGDKYSAVNITMRSDGYDVSLDSLMMRSRAESWEISRDGGQTWDETRPDPDIVGLMHGPLSGQFFAELGTSRPWAEEVGRVDKDGETLVHIRVIPSGFDRNAITFPPQYWILIRDGSKPFLRRYRGYTEFLRNVVVLDATYFNEKYPLGS